MKALVYRGPAKMGLEDRPKPEISAATDAIVKLIKTTICGTDPKVLITHRFMLDDILKAYETFGNAAKTNALKVLIEA